MQRRAQPPPRMLDETPPASARPRSLCADLARRTGRGGQPRSDTRTLNTSADSGCLFKVLSVESFNLRCVSTLVEMSRCTALYTNAALYNIRIKVECSRRGDLLH